MQKYIKYPNHRLLVARNYVSLDEKAHDNSRKNINFAHKNDPWPLSESPV
jgi:hypothetical protein